MNRYLSLTLSALLLFTALVDPTFAQSSQSDNLRRKVIEWGTNKPIAVKLKSGEKLKGRIADIKDDALSVQLLAQGKIVTRELRWDDLHKVSLDTRDEKARKFGGLIAGGVLATVFIVIVVALSDPNS